MKPVRADSILTPTSKNKFNVNWQTEKFKLCRWSLSNETLRTLAIDVVFDTSQRPQLEIFVSFLLRVAFSSRFDLPSSSCRGGGTENVKLERSDRSCLHSACCQTSGKVFSHWYQSKSAHTPTLICRDDWPIATPPEGQADTTRNDSFVAWSLRDSHTKSHN